ncbi:kinase-like protein [Trametes cingulata]|nr:kinase-like protein [Trametes cingulata]
MQDVLPQPRNDPFGTFGDGPSRPRLSPLFTHHEQSDSSPSTSYDSRAETSRMDSLLPLSHTDATKRPSNDDRLDPDQKISQALGLSISPPAILAMSEPEPLDHMLRSPVASPLSVNEFSEPDLSSSPAALFLSAFSPSTSERLLAPDDEGSVVAGYTLGPIVGHGGFSIIRTASSAQGGTVAVKIVRRSDLDKQPDPVLARKSLEREAAVWGSLNHEHILPLFTVNHTPYADFFITLYCPAGSLFDILKRDGRPALPQDDAGMMFRQVVRGLRYMHEVAGYVHGDLKLENVLVDEMGVCKIADFGMARKIGEIDDDLESEEDEEQAITSSDGSLRTRTLSQAPSFARRSLGRQAGIPALLNLKRRHAGPRHRNSSPYPSAGTPPPAIPNRCFAPGSLPYAAPELLLPPNHSPYAASPAQDIWALGVMLYALLTGKLPFSDSFEPRLQMKILHGVFEMPQDIGRSGEQVLQGCLERSVPNRWTIAMVDEVAWGIGWGSAADDVTPPPEAALSCRVSRSPSRSRTMSRKDNAVDDSESRRSSSRAARSASRSTSAVRTSSRSKSRAAHHHPYDHQFPHPLLQTERHPAHPLPTPPSLSSLTNAILRTSSSTSSDSASTPDTAIVLQPSLSSDSDLERERERGRMPRPRLYANPSVSRSRSPHDLPATPKDLSIDSVMRRAKSPPSRAILSNPDLDHSVSELDTLDEDARWHLSPSVDAEGSSARSRSSDVDMDSSVSRSSSGARRGRDSHRAFSRSRDELRRIMRNESMPPAFSPSSSWTSSAAKEPGWYSSGHVSVAAAATPMPIPINGAAPGRSKSLGPDRARHALYRPLVSTAHPGDQVCRT